MRRVGGRFRKQARRAGEKGGKAAKRGKGRGCTRLAQFGFKKSFEQHDRKQPS